MAYDTSYDKAHNQSSGPEQYPRGARVVPTEHYDSGHDASHSYQPKAYGTGMDQGGYQGGFEQHGDHSGVRGGDFSRFETAPGGRSAGSPIPGMVGYDSGYDKHGSHSGLNPTGDGYARNLDSNHAVGAGGRAGDYESHGMVPAPRGKTGLRPPTAYRPYYDPMAKNGSSPAPGAGYSNYYDGDNPTPGGGGSSKRMAMDAAYSLRYDREHKFGQFQDMPDEGRQEPQPEDSFNEVYSRGNVAHVSGGDDWGYGHRQESGLVASALRHDQFLWDGEKSALDKDGNFNNDWLKKMAKGRSAEARDAALEIKLQAIRGRA
jgi:hypothetical protein